MIRVKPYLYTQNQLFKRSFPVTQAKALYTGMEELNGDPFTNLHQLINFVCFDFAAFFFSSSILGSAIVFFFVC
jgi:hypothetical protein